MSTTLPRYRLVWLLLGWGLLVGILVMALKPLPGIALVEIWSDKVWHALAFITLMVWFSGVYAPQHFAKVFFALLLYGILIEALQSFTPNRHAEFADIFANFTGASLGWVLAGLGLSRWCHWLERGFRRS
jgi:VanZ family protein